MIKNRTRIVPIRARWHLLSTVPAVRIEGLSSRLLKPMADDRWIATASHMLGKCSRAVCHCDGFRSIIRLNVDSRPPKQLHPQPLHPQVLPSKTMEDLAIGMTNAIKNGHENLGFVRVRSSAVPIRY
jgi:hypothetical protein